MISESRSDQESGSVVDFGGHDSQCTENFDPDDPIWWRLEREWRESVKKYTPAELVKIFPDSKETIATLHKDRKRTLTIQKRALEIATRKLMVCEEYSVEWIEYKLAQIEFAKSIVILNEQIAHLSIMHGLHFNKNESWRRYHNFQSQKEIAHRVSMAELVKMYGGEVKRSGSNHVARCLFHNEKTASLTIFSNSNMAHCFGCGISVDSIGFIQRMRGVSFKEAVYILNEIGIHHEL